MEVLECKQEEVEVVVVQLGGVLLGSQHQAFLPTDHPIWAKVLSVQCLIP